MCAMEALANWNGEEMPLSAVRVSVLDRAFLFGDSIYEVIRVYGGRAWRLNDHVERLSNGLKDLRIPFDTSVIEQRIVGLLKRTGLQEALAYVQVTRGEAGRQHHFPLDCTPNCLIFVDRFDDPYRTARESGGKAVTFPDIRWMRNDIKATTLLANCMAATAAKDNGCIEALLVKNGMISEGSHTSAFGVSDGELIVSPSSPTVLPGITKKQVIELCTSAGIKMREGYLQVDEVGKLEELIITATPEEIIGIVELDGKPIADGNPGPVTKRLQQEFRSTISNWLSSS